MPSRPARLLPRAAAAVVTLAVLAGLLAVPTPAAAGADTELRPSAERQFLQLLNGERTDRGLAPLALRHGPRLVARHWSWTMAEQRDFRHRDPLAGPFTGRWTRLGENIAAGGTVKSMHRALMDSDGHRANILGSFSWVGIGVVVGPRGAMWVTFNFGAGSDQVASSFHADGRLSGGPFADVHGGHTFAASIDWLDDAGITRGCNPPANTRFCPDRPVTRGQMAAFLTRALDLPAPSRTGRFTDVPRRHTFRTPIAALAAAGITRGCNPPDNDRFCPDRAVTRGQMAAFLQRALDLPDARGRFADVPRDHTFRNPVAALAGAGITKGCNPPDNNRFCPDRPVTRGQMAAFLQRALG